MLDIKILRKSWFFKEIVLEKWEVLFKEWEIDNNLYIVLDWELSVEKYTTINKDEKKILAYLRAKDVFWESALNNNLPKSVSIIAKRKTIVIWINATKWLDEFMKVNPNEAMNLLKYIIYQWNKRLSEANYLITSAYKISQEITELKQINNKSIFYIIDKMKEVLKIDEILYYEVNPIIQNYVTLRYNTKHKWKMQNLLINIENNELDLLNNLINKNYFSFKQKLTLWDKEIWVLIFIKKDKNFEESEIKAIKTTSISFISLIKQKQILDEERDKEFMNE